MTRRNSALAARRRRGRDTAAPIPTPVRPLEQEGPPTPLHIIRSRLVEEFGEAYVADWLGPEAA